MVVDLQAYKKVPTEEEERANCASSGQASLGAHQYRWRAFWCPAVGALIGVSDSRQGGKKQEGGGEEGFFFLLFYLLVRVSYC